MKKNLIVGLILVIITLPAFASARTILTSRTYGGFCPPPGCPETIVKLDVDDFGWGQVKFIKFNGNGGVTKKATLAWIPPKVINQILETIEKVEESELFDTQENEHLITDIPLTDYKIVKKSNEEILVSKKFMGHLWIQKNYMGQSLANLLNSFSSLINVSYY